jgi:putative ABC transport system permease protein
MRRAVRLLNLRRLARVRLRMIIAVVAVAAGSSLALSVVIVDASASYSLNRLTQQVGGAAALRVVGATATGGINLQALDEVVTTPGVKGVIPVVQAITVVRTSHTHNQAVLALGVDCSAGALFNGIGCAGATATSAPPGDAIYISRSLQRRLTGSSWVETNRGTESLADATPLSSLDSVNRGDVVVIPLGRAQQLFNRMGRIDDIYVIPSSGVSSAVLAARLNRAIGPWDGVVDATTPPPAVSLALGAFTPILDILALLASAIAVVLVYNVISLTLEERRREHAIVAAIGAPPSVMIIGPLLEAGVLGAVGGLLGALGGIVLARPIVATLSHLTLALAGIPITLHTSSSTFVTGVVLGTFIGLVAAARPVRRAMRSDIAAEISGRDQREKTSTRATLRYALIYSVLAMGGVVLSWLGDRNGSLQTWQPTAALLGFVLALIFAILATGAWAPVVIRAISRSGRIRGGVRRLGVANLVREPGRTGVMAIAISAAVAVAFMTGSYNRAVDQDIASGFAQSSQYHSVLVTTAASSEGFNFDGQIPATVLAALGRLPGVTEVDDLNGEITGHTESQLTLVEAESYPSLRGTVFAGTGDLTAFRQGRVMVGANLARRDHLHQGSLLHLDTPSQVADVPVQGVWNDGNAAGDNVYMPLSLQERLFGPQLPSAVALTVARQIAPSRVAAEARRAHLGAYLKFSTPTQQLSNADKGTSGELAPFQVLQRALLLVSFISVLSTLLLVGIQRRREFGLLGAVGMTPKELFRMVVVEAVTVSVVAAFLGAALGFLLLASLLDVTPLLAGYHDTYSPDIASLLVFGPIAVIVAVAAAAWPGRQAARTPILEALKYE